jgi:SOS response regulatory protein OraA/RecX
MSRDRLAQRLERAAVPPAAAEESLDVLSRAGLLDDARFARVRAQALAERGYGDGAIRHVLGGEGIAGEIVDGAVEQLEPELMRVERLVQRRGIGPRTARYLAARGFSDEAIERALGEDFANGP